MAQIDVKDQLVERFAAPLEGIAARRIIIWHDASGEFEDLFDGLDGQELACGERPLRLVKAVDGAMFATKRIIAREDAKSDLLVYRQRSRGDLEGDWLADVEQYAEHFQADYLSMLVDELNAADTDEVRGALIRFRGFFAAKDRRSRFSAAVQAPGTEDDVLRGMFAVLFKVRGAARVESIVRAYAVALLGADVGEGGAGEGAEGGAAAEGSASSGALSQLDKYSLREAFASFLAAATGYSGPLDDAQSFMPHLLLSAASRTMLSDALDGLERFISAAHDQFALGIVRDWMQAQSDERQVLYDACRMVEETCNLVTRFSNLPIAALQDCDVFPGVNEAILNNLFDSLAQGADRCAEASAVIAKRKDMKWYKHLACYFDALGAVADLRAFYRDHAEGFHLAKADEAWRAYERDWWRADWHYRRFCTAYRRCLGAANPQLEDSVHSVAEWAENVYMNWFLEESNGCWIRAAERQWADVGYVEGVARQRRFYDEQVVVGLGGSKCAVVIISDALRYEVARGLAERIERETRGTCEVESMQATFPSITEFGMAALLPHKALSFSEADGGVYVDSMPTRTTLEREAVLKARNPRSCAIQAEAVLQMGRDERRELFASVEVCYIYHNKIDSTGEKHATEATVFDACETAITEICALVKRIANDLGNAKVAITADHGFLYSRRPLAERDHVDKRELPEESLAGGKRHIVASAEELIDYFDAADDAVLVRMNMEDVGGGSYMGLAPRQAIRIRRRGGTENYVHGGISLQEMCVPVVRFSSKRAGAKGAVAAEPAELAVLSTNRKITNSLFAVDLYQKQPVGGKVAPCEYELVFTDASGNEISDRRRAHADKDTPDEQARVSRIQFALSVGRTFKSNEPGFLVCRDKQTGTIAWKEEYAIDIAFAPMDDFGF